jgi:cell division septum initiation protein DivIVA
MAYISEQTSDELRAHMCKLKKMPGWHEPLADRLFKEIEAQDAEIERLQELLSDTRASIENERAAHQVCAEMRNQAEAERDRLKSAMRINAIIWNPRLSHDEINSEIERIMRGVLPVGQLTQDKK